MGTNHFDLQVYVKLGQPGAGLDRALYREVQGGWFGIYRTRASGLAATGQREQSTKKKSNQSSIHAHFEPIIVSIRESAGNARVSFSTPSSRLDCQEQDFETENSWTSSSGRDSQGRSIC